MEAIVSVHRVWQEELKLQKNLMLQTITDQRPYSPKSSIVVAMPSSSNVNSGNKADADFMDGKSRVKSPILGNTDDKPTSGAVIGALKVLLDDFILCDKNARVSKDESVIRNNTTGGTLLEYNFAEVLRNSKLWSGSILSDRLLHNLSLSFKDFSL